MALATKALRKQQRSIYLNYLLRGLALAALGLFGGIMILRDGAGEKIYVGFGGDLFLAMAAWLTEHGMNADQVLSYGFAAFFFLLAAIGLYYVVQGIRRMSPTRTVLGKSILTQLSGSQSFRETLANIDADMAQEPHIFGSIKIGRSWLLEVEAMRLADIRGVFRLDEGMEKFLLCCVDEGAHLWAAMLRYADDRDAAAEYLTKTLTNIETGDGDAFLAYCTAVGEGKNAQPS